MEGLRAILKWVGRHRLLSLLAVAAIVAVAIGGRILVSRTSGELSAPLERGIIVESVYGIGTVMANRSYQIKPGVISTILDLYVKEGDTVRKGDKLANIDRVIYRAPFDGTVCFLPFKVGENVFAQLPVLALVDLTDRYLVVSLEQQGALRVRPRQSVVMSFDSIREQSYKGVVESVYSFEGSFLARIDVSRLPPMVLPGMTADVAIEIRQRGDALLVPVAALENGFVWARRGGIPRRVTVRTGIVDKAMAEVVSGDLFPGDRVIIRKKPSP